MLRRTLSPILDLHTTTTASPSFRAHPMRNLMGTVVQSPYKDAFKEYWSTPVPWAPREYGPKPRIGDPIPLREAVTTLVVGKNNHIDPAKVASGEDNDYKILMMFREPQGRYTKDQFILPSNPINLQDKDEAWGPLLIRLGVKTPHSDMVKRIAAIRALFVEFNLIVLPPEGGGLAEANGPPGSRNWHMMVMQQPSLLRQFLDILEIPMENALKTLKPFVRIQTPNTEQFRFDSTTYIVPFPKIPDVKYTISTVGEELFWVSPKEALARYEAGVMELPTPTLILFNELDRLLPRFDDIMTKLNMDTEPRVICPELVHDPHTRMATVLVPGDIHHSETPALRAQIKEKRKKLKQMTMKIEESSTSSSSNKNNNNNSASGKKNSSNATSSSSLTKDQSAAETQMVSKKKGAENVDEDDDEDLPELLYRIHYEKDEPYGVRSVLTFRPIQEGEKVEEMPRVDEKFIEADSPQMLQAEAMEEEEKAYVRKQERKGLEDVKAFDKMMNSSPAGEPRN